MIQYPNRVSQTGTYHTGTPNYVDCSGAASTGMVTFVAKATSESWSDGDTLGILVETGNTYWLGLGTWDSANEHIELTTQEEAVGTLSDSESVTISAVLTKSVVDQITAPPLTREVLTSDRTYYVATDGDDDNDGLTDTTPFLTIQKAVDAVCSLDCNMYQATIQVADGTYAAGAELGATVGQKMLILQGNVTTPANVVVDTTSHCFTNSAPTAWQIQGFKLQTTGSYFCLNVDTPASTIWFDKIDFGTTGHSHIVSTNGGLNGAVSGAAYTISGSATQNHILASKSGMFVALTDATVTLTGTPSFNTFITASLLACVAYSPTIVGSATGVRYSVVENAALDVSGNGVTYLPGDDSGTTAEGGLYT